MKAVTTPPPPPSLSDPSPRPIRAARLLQTAPGPMAPAGRAPRAPRGAPWGESGGGESRAPLTDALPSRRCRGCIARIKGGIECARRACSGVHRPHTGGHFLHPGVITHSQGRTACSQTPNLRSCTTHAQGCAACSQGCIPHAQDPIAHHPAGLVDSVLRSLCSSLSSQPSRKLRDCSQAPCSHPGVPWKGR